MVNRTRFIVFPGVHLPLFEGVLVTHRRAVSLMALKAISMDSHDN